MHTHTCIFTYELEHSPSLRDILSLIAVRRTMTGLKLDFLIQIPNKNCQCLDSSRIYSRTRPTNECNGKRRHTPTHARTHISIHALTHTHTHMHTHPHTHTHTYMRMQMQVHSHIHGRAHARTHVHARTRTRTHTHTHTHTHIHTSGFVIIWSIAKTARDMLPLLFATTNTAS